MESAVNSVEHCATCAKPLGSLVQETMFNVPKRCIDCLSAERVQMMLAACPDEYDAAFRKLSTGERSFLTSVRKQFTAKGHISDKQYRVLEQLYEKS